MQDHEQLVQDQPERLVDESNGNETNNVSEEDLERAVLRILEAKVKNGWSRSDTLNEIRNIYELFKNEECCATISEKAWIQRSSELQSMYWKESYDVGGV